MRIIKRKIIICSGKGERAASLLRDRLARIHTEVEIMGYLGKRSLTNFLSGGIPGPTESMFKIYWSEYHRLSTELSLPHPRHSTRIATGNG